AVDLDDGRGPRRVAADRRELAEAVVGPVEAEELRPQRLRRVHDQTGFEVGAALRLEPVELFLQLREIVVCERDRLLPVRRPAAGTIERLARHVRGEEAEPRQLELPRELDRLAEVAEVQPVDGAASEDRKRRTVTSQ